MIKWFQRKFNFNDLEGTLPSLLERLQDAPLRLEAKISTIPERFYTQRLGELWTIQEQVGHLVDLEPLWENRFKDFLKGKEILTEADLSNTKTHQGGHNEKNMQDLLNEFRDKRLTLCLVLKSFGPKAEQWHSKHPRLGTPMRPIDLAYFVAEHDDHHLAKVSHLHRELMAS